MIGPTVRHARSKVKQKTTLEYGGLNSEGCVVFWREGSLPVLIPRTSSQLVTDLGVN